VVECIGYVSNSSNTLTTYNYTASGGQTEFNATNVASDIVNVFLNGVLLDSTDYNLNTTNKVTLSSGATASDIVHIQVIGALDNSNFVPAGGGTFTGNVAVTGDLTVDTSTLKVDSTNNNIGIGTASPSDQGTGRTHLHIHSSSTDYSYISLTNNTSGSDATANGTNILSDTNNFKILNRESGGHIALQTTGAGKTGIGVGSFTPSELVEVQQSVAGTMTTLKVDNEDNTNTASHSALFVSVGGSSAGDPMAIFNNRNTNWTMGMDNSDSDKFVIANSYADLSSNARITMTEGGDVTVNSGNVIIGTAGKGIDFSNASDVATGETVGTNGSILDDYEEGTWTPSIGTSSSHGSDTINVTISATQYVKVGRLVRVNFTGQRTDSGTWSSGNIYLRNLPYTSNAVANLTGHVWLDSGSGNGYKCFFYTGGNSTTVILSHGSTPSTASRYVAPPDTYLANNWYFYGSLTYTTTT
jgi:hypothetical protein